MTEQPEVRHRDKVGWFLLWPDGYTSAMPDEQTARLLAAAPDLLAALKAILVEATRGGFTTVIKQARAAIAKVQASPSYMSETYQFSPVSEQRDELLAVLSHVLSIYGESWTENTRIQARAAIAKATEAT